MADSLPMIWEYSEPIYILQNMNQSVREFRCVIVVAPNHILNGITSHEIGVTLGLDFPRFQHFVILAT